jgi:hypothetical protein
MRISRRQMLAAASAVALGACKGSGSEAGTNVELGPMVAPADLAGRIEDARAGRVAVLYVGPEELFARGRVPGAQKLPPVERDEGRRALARVLSETPAGTEIVVYCGCCPYASCPNVRPASAEIRASGRTNARFLDLPTSFKKDWVEQGYPVDKG